MREQAGHRRGGRVLSPGFIDATPIPIRSIEIRPCFQSSARVTTQVRASAYAPVNESTRAFWAGYIWPGQKFPGTGETLLRPIRDKKAAPRRVFASCAGTEPSGRLSWGLRTPGPGRAGPQKAPPGKSSFAFSGLITPASAKGGNEPWQKLAETGTTEPHESESETFSRPWPKPRPWKADRRAGTDFSPRPWARRDSWGREGLPRMVDDARACGMTTIDQYPYDSCQQREILLLGQAGGVAAIARLADPAP